MTKSALQIARAAYLPKVPAALKGAVKAVDGEYTESVADQEDIKKLFPNTYGMPVVTFEKSNEKKELPWWQKYTLTLNEASEYFGIGYKKLKLFVQEHSDEDFVLWNGNRALIKREQFEKYMDSQMNVI